jgi:hypothetical protein
VIDRRSSLLLDKSLMVITRIFQPQDWRQVPIVISNRASPWVVGCSEPIEKKERVELDYVSRTATGTTQQTQSPSLLPREIDLLIPSK